MANMMAHGIQELRLLALSLVVGPRSKEIQELDFFRLSVIQPCHLAWVSSLAHVGSHKSTLPR